MITRKGILAGIGVSLAFPALTPAAGAAQTMKLGHIMSANHPVNLAALNFAEGVKTRTNGAISIVVYPAGQLGQEREMFESIRIGGLDMGYIAGNAIEVFEPSEGLFSLPYLFKSNAQVFKIQDGPIGQDVAARVLAKTGVRYLAYGHVGFRSTLTKSKPIKVVTDFNGLKIRVPPSPSFVSAFKLLGAIPTAVPGGEMYTALQSGLVDGVEGAPDILNDFKMFEIAKNYTLTQHIYTDIPLVISDSVWKNLSPSYQKAFADSARAATLYQRALAQNVERQTMDHLHSIGVTVIKIDTAPMRAKMTPYYNEFNAKVGGSTLIDQVGAVPG